MIQCDTAAARQHTRLCTRRTVRHLTHNKQALQGLHEAVVASRWKCRSLRPCNPSTGRPCCCRRRRPGERVRRIKYWRATSTVAKPSPRFSQLCILIAPLKLYEATPVSDACPAEAVGRHRDGRGGAEGGVGPRPSRRKGKSRWRSSDVYSTSHYDVNRWRAHRSNCTCVVFDERQRNCQLRRCTHQLQLERKYNWNTFCCWNAVWRIWNCSLTLSCNQVSK